MTVQPCMVWIPIKRKKKFLWIATSGADVPADNPNGNKTFLVNGISTFFINGKPAVINGLRKFKNSSSWLVMFLVVPFNKIPLITFRISFISLFVRVIPEPTLIGKSF